MAYDEATGKTVLFGGVDASGAILGDTWIWNGTTWARQQPAVSPPASEDASMAYDPATRTVVLFGGEAAGQNGTSTRLSSTWTWNGRTWLKHVPATSPSARAGSSMAYDPATRTVVLFGGSAAGYLDDTWTWNGTNWTKQSPANHPSARASAAVAYDPGTTSIVLFGGVRGGKKPFLADTWIWDGGDWTNLPLAMAPSDRYGASLVYNGSVRRLMLFGSFDTHLILEAG